MIIRKAVNKDIDGISDLIQKVTDNNPNNYSLEQIVPPYSMIKTSKNC